MKSTHVISMQSVQAADGTWQTACIISGLADQRQADAAESCLQSLLCGPQIGGLSEGDAVITGMGHVDQGVSVAAPRAHEVGAVSVDLGLHGPEHDLKPTATALPHGAPPSESYCGGMAHIAAVPALLACVRDLVGQITAFAEQHGEADFETGRATRLLSQLGAEPVSPADELGTDRHPQEPDCWAILTPNGSRLVSPEEAKGRKGAYPLYTRPQRA